MCRKIKSLHRKSLVCLRVFRLVFLRKTRLFVIVGLDPTIYFVLARAATSC